MKEICGFGYFRSYEVFLYFISLLILGLFSFFFVIFIIIFILINILSFGLIYLVFKNVNYSDFSSYYKFVI